MQFSLTTAIAALATIHTVNAWRISAMATPDCTETDIWRKLTQDGPSGCRVFGQDMAGVACEQWNPSTNAFEGCVTEGFTSKSIVVAQGTTCVLYKTPECVGGDGASLVVGPVGGFLCSKSDSDEGFKAYECWENGDPTENPAEPLPTSIEQ
ncbi:hypothetical protein FALBO_695 [Fusarium albosuccineum]|uniref:Small secreted protein n=1 Tax=Fusarium albosuccineum TaxID=1237068 RepID=A0A8H4LQ23_9HYPO|nr:hypothetical protein FALBO_695 [Fusarium albosuccineum]